MDPAERRAGERMVEASREQSGHRLGVNRTDLQALVRKVDEGQVQTRPRRRAMLDASREQNADSVAVKAADRESKGLRRRRVEPLDVVDGNEDRSIDGNCAQRVETGDRDRSGIGIRALRLDAEQSHAKRRALWDRQVGERAIGNRLQEVAEACVGEGRLGIGRAGEQHAP